MSYNDNGVPETGNGWNQYKRLVLAQLDSLKVQIEVVDGKIDLLRRALDDIKTDLTITKTKIGTYATVAGVVVSVVMQFVFAYLKNLL